MAAPFFTFSQFELIDRETNHIIEEVTRIEAVFNREPHSFMNFIREELLRLDDAYFRRNLIKAILIVAIKTAERQTIFDKDSFAQIYNFFILHNEENFQTSFQLFAFLFSSMARINEMYYSAALTTAAQFFQPFSKMFPVEHLLLSLLREVFDCRASPARLEFYRRLFEYLRAETTGILESVSDDFVTILFYKVIKTMAICKANKLLFDLESNLIELATALYDRCPSICLNSGRELFVAIKEISTNKKFQQLYSQINLEQLFRCSIDKRLHVLLMTSNIPTFIERMILFVITDGNRSSFNKQMNWIFRESQTILGEHSESFIVDMIRYVMICTREIHSIHERVRIRRWLILGWLINSIRTETVKSVAKQALFVDWIMFDNPNNEDTFSKIGMEIETPFNNDPNDRQMLMQQLLEIVRPGWEIAINSLTKYYDFSHELFDHLVQIANEFDAQLNIGKALLAIKNENPALFLQLDKQKRIQEDVWKKLKEFLVLAEVQVSEVTRTYSPFGSSLMKAPDSLGTSDITNVGNTMKIDYGSSTYDPFKATESNAYENDSTHKSITQLDKMNESDIKNNLEKKYYSNGELSSNATVTENYIALVSKYQLETLIKMTTVRVQSGEQYFHNIYPPESIESYNQSLHQLLVDLETANHLNNSSNYSLSGFFSLDSFEPSSIQTLPLFVLLDYAEKMFVSDLQSYFDTEQFIVFLIERSIDLCAEALVIIYEAYKGNLSNQKNLTEIVSRIFQRFKSTDEVALKLFKWVFCRVEFGIQFELIMFFLDLFKSFKNKEPLITLQKNWLLSLDNFMLTRTLNDENLVDACIEVIAMDFNEAMLIGEKSVNTSIMMNFMNLITATIVSGKRPALESLKAVMSYLDRCDCNDSGLEKELKTFLYMITQVADEVNSIENQN